MVVPILGTSIKATNTRNKEKVFQKHFSRPEIAAAPVGTRWSTFLTAGPGSVILPLPLIIDGLLVPERRIFVSQTSLTDPEYALLALLGKEELPLGAGALRLALENQGFQLSEATTGRMLQRLDRLGYTERCGFQGRRLSPEGRQLYEATRILRHRLQSARGVMSALSDEDRRVIVETLEVRRALEGETARLAAERATEDDLVVLRSLVEEQLASVRAGQSMAALDGLFHRTLAKISGNRLLESSVDLLRQDPLWAPLLEYVRRKEGSSLGADHRAVVQAVASRNPQEARDAMERHLDNVLGDVRHFLEIHPEGFPGLVFEGALCSHDAL